MPYKIVYKAFAERDIWEIAGYLSDFSMSAVENSLIKLDNSKKCL